MNTPREEALFVLAVEKPAAEGVAWLNRERGCGVVYVAEQTEPVRRRVALQVIKLGIERGQTITLSH